MCTSMSRASSFSTSASPTSMASTWSIPSAKPGFRNVALLVYSAMGRRKRRPVPLRLGTTEFLTKSRAALQLRKTCGPTLERR